MSYLALLIAMRGSLEKNRIPAWLGLWWVHGLFLSIGLALLYWETMQLKWASWRAAKREVARG
jgi:lipopolysaccharide export system permease protein